MNNSNLLMKRQPLVIGVDLATIIGLNEAIVLQQIEYWIEINTKAKKALVYKDGFYWTFQTVKEWTEQFPFWSYDTVKRTLAKLKKNGILITTDKYNKLFGDKTLWYRINYERLNELERLHNEKTSACEENGCACERAGDNQEQNSQEKAPQPASALNSANCPSRRVQIAPLEECKLPQAIQEINNKINNEINNTTRTESASSGEQEEVNNYIEENTHLILSPYQRNKVTKKWTMQKIVIAIEIFKSKNGEFFELLKQIYNDSGNFVPKSNKGKNKPLKFANFAQRDYDYNSLEKQLLGWDKE